MDDTLPLIDTALPDVKLIDLSVHHDERGYFLESFQARRYEALPGLPGPFVQDNYSYSKRHVLRGPRRPPFVSGKVWCCRMSSRSSGYRHLVV